MFYKCIFFTLIFYSQLIYCFDISPNQIIGKVELYNCIKDESLYEIAKRFDLGIDELIKANKGISKDYIFKEGEKLFIPKIHILPPEPHEGIIINKAELRLYFFENSSVYTYPVSLGKIGRSTPLVSTKVTYKEINPTWYVPESILKEDPNLPPIVPPGKNNPLGKYAIHLNIPRILIHSTNEPDIIGSYNSHGCIRMKPDDISILFPMVKSQMPVRIIDEHVLLGVRDNKLYLLNLPHGEPKYEKSSYKNQKIDMNSKYIKNQIIKKYSNLIDINKLDNALKEYSTIPKLISKLNN